MTTKLRWVAQLLTTIIVALMLFFYATTNNYHTNVTDTSQSSNTTETFKHEVTDVPLLVEYDNENTFISGLPLTLTVEISSSNRVLLQQETNPETRQFYVKVNLTKRSLGKHVIKFEASNVPEGVTVTVKSPPATVTIGQLVHKEFDVVATVKQEQLAEGYAVESVTLKPAKVRVAADYETLAKIDHIEAVTADIDGLKRKYTGKVNIQAVDKDGNPLPVSLSYTSTVITINVKKA